MFLLPTFSISAAAGMGSRLMARWAEKRFAEDLLVVLSDMGHPVSSDTVSLTLIDSQTGEQKKETRAQMTGANRGAIIQDRDLVNSNLLTSIKIQK